MSALIRCMAVWAARGSSQNVGLAACVSISLISVSLAATSKTHREVFDGFPHRIELGEHVFHFPDSAESNVCRLYCKMRGLYTLIQGKVAEPHPPTPSP